MYSEQCFVVVSVHAKEITLFCYDTHYCVIETGWQLIEFFKYIWCLPLPLLKDSCKQANQSAIQSDWTATCI